MSQRPTPVIVVSGLSSRENVFRALELGALDFVAKPSQKLTPELRTIEVELRRKLELVTQLRMVSLSDRAAKRAALSTTASLPVVPPASAPGGATVARKAGIERLLVEDHPGLFRVRFDVIDRHNPDADGAGRAVGRQQAHDGRRQLAVFREAARRGRPKISKGLVRLCEGNRINYHDVMDWFNEIKESDDLYFYKIGYDSWNAKYIVDEIEMLVGKQGTIPIIQGPKTFSSPLKSMEAELKANKVVYNNSPILRWNLANAKVNIDRNDNLSLIKTSSPTKRIDGVASLMDAFIVYENHKEEYLSMI
jgi:hypothetical protein